MTNPTIIDCPERYELNTIADIEEIYESRTLRSQTYISILSDIVSEIDDASAIIEVRVRAAGKRFVLRQENGIWRWEMR